MTLNQYIDFHFKPIACNLEIDKLFSFSFLLDEMSLRIFLGISEADVAYLRGLAL